MATATTADRSFRPSWTERIAAGGLVVTLDTLAWIGYVRLQITNRRPPSTSPEPNSVITLRLEAPQLPVLH